MYTKDEFNKYYLAGKAIAEPIHVDIDLQSCDTTFYCDEDSNMTGFIYPIKLSGIDETTALFVSDTPSLLLHDGNGDIDYQDLTFCDRCWYIGYSDYVKFVKQHSFTV